MPYKPRPRSAMVQNTGAFTSLAVPPLKVLLHDLKNPLAHIQSTTELLRLMLNERQDGAAEYEQYLQILDLSARRAVLLVQRVQLLEQLREQQVPCRLQPQPLHLIAKDAAHLYQIWAEQRHIQLDLALEAVWVQADEGFLAQIIDNLLSNAIKYSNPSSRIRIQSCIEGQIGHLTIADQGPGIPAAEQSHLFEPSNSWNAPASIEPAHGLGLAITKQLCELMQGRIVFESLPSGTSFSVFLPIAES